MKLKKIVIDNTKDSAIESKHWDPNVKELIENAVNSTAQNTLLKEIFLVHPDGIEVQNPREYKYPHHAIVGDKCVLDVAGVKAAYARAKQQGIYEGAIKEHLDQHREDLGSIAKEAKKESITNEVDKALSLLKEALRPKVEYQSDNMFTQMFEKPIVTPAENGTPVGGTAQPAAQPQATPVDTTQAAPAPDPSTQPTTDQPTIPVQNANPAEDTSTNNPVEGPDDRDQDNLDGIQRKEMYQQWADLMVQLNSNNVFGTIFDQDVFKSEYKIVPYEMRYFYRLQNPVSVAIDDLAFIPFGTELLEAQEKYGLGKKMFVFATNNEKPIFFNMLDKTIWFNDTKLNDSFDGFIEQLTQNNGELQIPEDNEEADVEYQQNPSEISQDTTTPNASMQDQSSTTDQAPMDLSQGNQNMTVTTGLEDNTAMPTEQPTQDANAPVDLTQQNASYEFDADDDSVLAMMEGKRLDKLKKNAKKIAIGALVAGGAIAGGVAAKKSYDNYINSPEYAKTSRSDDSKVAKVSDWLAHEADKMAVGSDLERTPFGYVKKKEKKANQPEFTKKDRDLIELLSLVVDTVDDTENGVNSTTKTESYDYDNIDDSIITMVEDTEIENFF